MDFYHKNDFEQLTECPPNTYKEMKCNCYRWVFSDMSNIKNFQSQGEKNPKALNDKTDVQKCEYFALSFHMSMEKSREHYSILNKRFKNISKKLGTHIANGYLEECDGIGGEVDDLSHFNFHFVKNKNFCNKFKILEEI